MAKEVVALIGQDGESPALSEQVLRDIETVDGLRREAVRREDPARRPMAEHLASELFDYAYNRLRSKMRSGEIVALVKQVGSKTPLVLTAQDLDDLNRHQGYRDELAVRTIGEAWKSFYTKSVLGRKWNPEENADGRTPASLKSYFFGMCLLHFPRVYWNWSVEQQDTFAEHARTMTADQLESAFGYHTEQTPELVSAVCEQIRIMIDTAKPRIRSVIALALEDYPPSEIAEKLGMTVPMVDNILYRFRQAARSKVFQIWKREPHELLSFEAKLGSAA